MKKFLILLVLPLYLLAYKSVVIKVDGMTCPLCTMAVKKSLKKVRGVKKVKVKLNSKKAFIKYENRKDIEKDFLQAIKNAGYKGKIISNKK